MKQTKADEEKMRMVTQFLPKTLIEALDKLVEEKWSPNRSELIRACIYIGLQQLLSSIDKIDEIVKKNA